MKDSLTLLEERLRKDSMLRIEEMEHTLKSMNNEKPEVG